MTPSGDKITEFGNKARDVVDRTLAVRGKAFWHPEAGAYMMATVPIPDRRPDLNGKYVRCVYLSGESRGYTCTVEYSLVLEWATSDPLKGLEEGR